MKVWRESRSRTQEFLQFAVALAVGGGIATALLSANAQTVPQKGAPLVRTDVTTSGAAAPALATQCARAAATCAPNSSILGPCSIATPGLYVLGGDVQEAGNAADAIDIGVSGVTLDLNGHRIYGAATNGCVGINACPKPTSGNTVCNPKVTVYNGTVTGFGWYGIQLGVTGNGGQDIVREVHSYNNGLGTQGGSGIVLGDESIATNNIVYSNGSAKGTSDGIDCGNNCILEANVADGNFNTGLYTGSGGNVLLNAADGNQYGLRLGTNTGYCNNEMDGNSMGNVTGTGSEYCKNACTGSSC